MDPPRVSKPDLAPITTEMPSPGNVALLEDRRLGALVTNLTKEDPQAPRLGPVTATVDRTTTTATVAVVVATTATTVRPTEVLLAVLLLGSRLPELRVGILDIPATTAMVLLPEWVHLLVSLRFLAVLPLLRVLASTLSFSSIPALSRLRPRLLERLLLLPRATSLLLLLPPAPRRWRDSDLTLTCYTSRMQWFP